jgi:hypothetical protein
MKGDFSRPTRTPNATRVLMQQGRVQLDADWNESVSLGIERLRAVAADLIGPHGGPKQALGYGVLARDSEPARLEAAGAAGLAAQLQPGDFIVARGRYYVGGWGCQTGTVLYGAQPDLPGTKRLSSLDPQTLWTALFEVWGGSPDRLPPVGDGLLVYLDTWERHVCAAEDPSLLDVALGGLDTATRAVLMAQVRVVPGPAGGARPPRGGARAAATEEQALAHLHALFPEERRPQLKARAKMPSDDAGPCLSDPDARYRGPENQLYRVEIHHGGEAGQATFKWSRDNGSLVFPVTELAATRATLSNLGRDERQTLAVGQWVELLDAVRAKRGAPGVMLRVTKVDGDACAVEFEAPEGVDVPDPDDLERPILRRWDHALRPVAEGGATLREGALVVAEAEGQVGWVKLEDGVEVQFQKAGPNAEAYRYRSGDYWLIPARTATGDVEWPRDAQGDPLPQGRLGVSHRYAPLALVTLDSGGHVVVQKDYRREFAGLALPVA